MNRIEELEVTIANLEAEVGRLGAALALEAKMREAAAEIATRHQRRADYAVDLLDQLYRESWVPEALRVEVRALIAGRWKGDRSDAEERVYDPDQIFGHIELHADVERRENDDGSITIMNRRETYGRYGALLKMELVPGVTYRRS